MSGFLLDTNVVSELIRPRPDANVRRWVDATQEILLYLSVLTIGEIRKGITSLPQSSRRSRLESWLDHDLRGRFSNRILPIDPQIADRWGRIAGNLAARHLAVPVIDGLLAATATQYDLTLVTRNTDDVAMTGAPVLNPWAP